MWDKGPTSPFVCGYPVFTESFTEQAIIFYYIFLTPISKISWLYTPGVISGLSILPRCSSCMWFYACTLLFWSLWLCFFFSQDWVKFFFFNFFLLVWFHISFRCFSISIKMPLEFWWRLHLIWIPLWISCEFDAVYVCHECFRLPMHGSFTSLVSDFNSCSFLHKTVGFEEQVGAGWEAFWTSIIAEPKHPLKAWSWSDCSNYLGLL